MKTLGLISSCCLIFACGHRATTGMSGGTHPPAQASQDDACFGGTPDPVIANVGTGSINFADDNGTALFVGGGNLVWQMWEGPASVNLATRQRGHARLGFHVFFKTADEHEAYSVSYNLPEPSEFDMQLVAADLKTGKQRTVIGGKDGETGLSPDTHVALDGPYVYFIRPKPYGAPTEKNGFFRARRDGTGEMERIGAEPQGMRTPFVIDGDYVYWNRDDGTGGPALWRRALAPESPVQRLAPTKDHHLPLFIDHGRIFYADETGISSVPVDGSAAPTIHARNVGTGRTSVVADQACVYWTNERGIFRTRLGRPDVSELIADSSSYRGGPIVTDGQHLYWMDRRHDRILSMARSAKSLPEPPVLVAKPIDASVLPADSAGPKSTVLVGDGWGCAKVFGWNQAHWQCWNGGGGGKTGAPVHAKLVTGLSQTADPAVASDRLCFLDGDEGKCWSWKELERGKPADFLEAQVRKGRLGEWLVGGTFSCLLQYVGAERMLACSGDNAYGQLAQKDQPVALERWEGALGGWHGCVVGRNETRDLDCWGRGDAGQLGRVPGGTCAVDGKNIPCDANLRSTDFTIPGVHSLYAGDMFTCAMLSHPRELRCWGGNRDGWFGDSPCSAELRRAWPVGAGFVAAPKAMCSTVPVRVVEPGSDVQDASVGPRGMCLVEDGSLRCLGAIPTPSVPVAKVAVSKGAKASACGIDGSRVMCWGEGYSPAAQPGLAVPIVFQGTTPASAVVDTPPPEGKTWTEDHLINQGCQRVPVSLSTCDAHTTGEAWATLAGKGDGLRDQRVSVRGRLVVGDLVNSPFVNTVCSSETRNPRARTLHDGPGGHIPPGTTPLGCYRDQRRIVLDGGATPLRLWDPAVKFDCVGDESRLCCGVTAFGQTVIATGILTGSAGRGWSLKGATLCEVASR